MTQPIEFSSHQAIKQSVFDQLLNSPGFVLIQGDAGSGKTQLKEQFVKKLRSRLLVLDLPYCHYQFDELLFTLAERLKIRYQESDLESCQQALSKFTQLKERTGTPFTLIIDDAQFIPLETLQALKQATDSQAPARLALRGILLSDRSLSEKLQFQFMENSLLSTVISMPRLTEADMHSFISQQLAQSTNVQIEPMAEQLILIAAMGNLRRAKQLVQQSIALCRQQQSGLITETMVEELSGSDEQLPVLDRPLAEGNASIPEDLRGILTHSLLDTPDKPILKQKRADQDTPLFVNDLSNAQVTPVPPTALRGNMQDAIGQPQPSEVPKSTTPPPPTAPSAATDTEATKQATSSEGSAISPVSEPNAAKEKTTKSAPAADISTQENQQEALTASREHSAVNLKEEPPTATIDSETTDKQISKPPKTLRWVAAACLLVFTGALGWLASQPGFNPAAKLEQLKQQTRQLTGQASPSETAKDPVSQDKSQNLAAKQTTVTAGQGQKPEQQTPITTADIETAAPDDSTTSAGLAATEQETQLSDAQTTAKQTTTETNTTDTPAPDIETTAAMTEALAVIENQLAESEQRQDAPPTVADVEAIVTSHQQTAQAEITEPTTTAETVQSFSPAPTPTAAARTAVEQDTDLLHAQATAAQLAMLEKKAQIHLDNYRYTIPEEDNAVLTLRRILNIDGENSWAQERMQWINDQYMRRAKAAEATGNAAIAVQNYARLLWIDPNQPEARAGLNRFSASNNAPSSNQ